MIKMEFDEVLQCEFPDVISVKKLEKVKSVLQETLRFWPPFPRTGRSCISEHVIGEKTSMPIRIPAGTHIICQSYTLHRDPEFWENPLEFEPLRFMRATEHGKRRHAYQYMPFGGGKRLCIGSHFALTEAIIIVSMILQRFEWTYDENNKVSPFIGLAAMRPRYGIKVDAKLI